MDSETPIVKLIAGAVGLVVVCFCVGFFLLGGRSSSNPAPVVATRTDATPPPLTVESANSPQLSVIETSERKPTTSPSLRVGSANVTEEAVPAPRPTTEPKEKPAPSDTSEGAAPAPTSKPVAAKRKPSTGDALPLPAPRADEKEPTPEPDKSASGDESKPGDGGSDSLYRVRVKNSFGSHDDADQLASELKGRGFAASVMPAGKGKFQVQIGAYKDKKRAEEKQKELEKNNYETHISDKNNDSAKNADKSVKSEPEKSDKGTKKEESGEKKSGDG